MEYRTITPEEYDEFRRITKYAFTVSQDHLDYWLSKDMDLSIAKAVFDGGKMVSIAQVLPFRVFFGDTLIPMGGYSGVATPPEYRRKRYIRHLLFHSLSEMRDNKVPLSYLYPFDFSYYRKFGWEQASSVHILKIDPEYFHGIAEVDGQMKLTEPDETKDLNEVYEVFARRYNSCCQRDKNYWKKLLTPPNTNRYGYLWYDSLGSPGGYLIYDILEKAADPMPQLNLRFREWAALNGNARLGIFRFLRDHDANIERIIMRHPSDIPVVPYLNNPRVEYEIKPGFMARIVDVVQAFEAKSYPPGLAGKVRFQITDEFCNWNTDAFTLTIEGGKARVVGGASDVDFATDICTLAALYVGFWSLKDAFDIGRIHDITAADVDRFSPLFSERIPYLINFF
jgi:predicted acetyltransferase